ncbi:MAG: hypothetical protein U0807_02615 [Candidatus Binatia bacterium]
MVRASRGRLTELVLVGVLAAATPVSAGAQSVASAFASGVGSREGSGRTGPVTLYVVPDGRRFLLTDVLVANGGQDVGPLYLADSSGTRIAIGLVEPTVVNQGATVLQQVKNPHVTFTNGIVFEAGEPIVATLANGLRGVDVTISGRLVTGPRRPRGVRLPGGARGDGGDEPGGATVPSEP